MKASPRPASGLLRLRIKPTAETQLRRGHPWLFAASIREQNRDGDLGELAAIYDRRDRFLALGLFDPESELRVRVLARGSPIPITQSWWRERLQEALRRREGLFDAATTGFRCIHGESDGWPGLVLDRYGQTLVLKLYTAAWGPRLSDILPLILEAVPSSRLVLRLSRNSLPTFRTAFKLEDAQVLSGDPPAQPPIFLESGLRFEADVLRGQKTGFFLDQRENRRRVEELSAGRDVLNVFSYTGGFSLYAARGGASSVMELDISEHALAGARRNFELNGALRPIADCQRSQIRADAFEWLHDAGGGRQFGLIVVDPPSLAKRASEKPSALAAYARLVDGALRRLRPGGYLVAASCSAHVSRGEFFETVQRVAGRGGAPFQMLQTTGHPPDHPAGFVEAEYLKCIYLRMAS